LIDLRSDTVTKPNRQMRDAMCHAEVGDDVYGDDPSVNQLEALAAELLDKESALFLPSGTQSNLVALLCHCQRGDEYIVGGDAHTYKYEAGGAAVLGSIQPQPIAFGDNGVLPLDDVMAAIKVDDFHFAKTRLLCLENTQHGRVVPMQYLADARDLSDSRNLMLHLDGARVFNAATALDLPVSAITRYFDSVSICLSKGLGAPVGSVLVGSESFIATARRWRKMVGGGMRQAGILAAAGMLALTEGAARLAEDHKNAAHLATLLDAIDSVEVNHEWTQTNMVWVKFQQPSGDMLQRFAADHGVLLSPDNLGGCRFVTHADVTHADMQKCADVIHRFFN